MLLEPAPVDDLQSNALRLFLGDGPLQIIGRLASNGPSDSLQAGAASSLLLLAGTDARTEPGVLGATLAERVRQLPATGRVAVLARSPSFGSEGALGRLLGWARARKAKREARAVPHDVVGAAVRATGFADVRTWSVGPSTEEPVELRAVAALGVETPAYLVTAGVSGSALPCVLECAVQQLAAAKGSSVVPAVRHVVNSTRGKSVAIVEEGADRWVIRIARSAAMLEDETRSYAVLEELQRCSSVGTLVPRPLGVAEAGGFSFLAQSHLPGVPLSTVLNEGNRAHYVAEVATFLRGLNADPSTRASVRYDDEQALALYTPMIDFALSHLTDDALKATVRSELLHALAGVSGRMGIVHGDFGPANLLVEGSRLTGVIDWEAARRRAPLVLDAVNYLDSAHRCCHPEAGIAETLPMLAADRWPMAQERAFLREWFAENRVDYRFLRGAALLYALFHFGPQLRFARADAGPARRMQATLCELIEMR